MPHDYLATKTLDDEFGWPSVNYSDLYNSEHPESPIPRSYSRTASPYSPGQFNARTTATAEAARQAQVSVPDSGQHANGWVNPALNPIIPKAVYSTYANPEAVEAVVKSQRPTADYSSAGKSYEELHPQTDLGRYGGYYSGGRFNAYGPPTGSRVNDVLQQFDNPTEKGRANMQSYNDTLMGNEASFQAKQKLERQQRLRGSLIGNSAIQNRKTGITDLKTFGRAPTEIELAYA